MEIPWFSKIDIEFFFIAEIAIMEIPKHAKETQVISKPINFALYVENNLIYYTSKKNHL